MSGFCLIPFGATTSGISPIPLDTTSVSIAGQLVNCTPAPYSPELDAQNWNLTFSRGKFGARVVTPLKDDIWASTRNTIKDLTFAIDRFASRLFTLPGAQAIEPPSAKEQESDDDGDVCEFDGATIVGDSSGIGATRHRYAGGADTRIDLKPSSQIEKKAQEIAKSLAKDLMIDHRPALVWIAEHGTKETMKALIEGGADVNGVDDEGKTALHMAVVDPKNYHKVWVLLQNGANPRAKDNAGNTPLSLAIALIDVEGMEDIISLLGEYKDVPIF